MNKVFDNDNTVVWKAMVFDDKSAVALNHAMISFIYGRSEICIVNVIKRNECIDVYVGILNSHDLQFRFYNAAGYDSFKKILASKYPRLEAVYNDGVQTLYGVNIDASRAYNKSMLLAARICANGFADDDEKWNDFCESVHDDYMFLLSDYIINDVRFSESINKRLESAPDSDKLLAVINDN